MPHIYPKGCVFNTISDIKDKKITIMGLGLNGGGEACVRFLQKARAKLTVTDMKSEKDLEPTLNSLKKDLGHDFSNINFVLGRHEISDFENADCVIKNPGVKYDGNKFLEAAKAIETDLSLFLQFTQAPIIAVTGSKGKSSTVSAIYYGLKEAGFDAFLGGNITVSPLTFLEQTSESTPVVLELSSWQLADLRGRGLLRPNITLITKIVPDHQNWYGNMESYVADKKLIYADQSENQYTICTCDDDWGKLFTSETKGKVLWYSLNQFDENLDCEKGVFFDENKVGYLVKSPNETVKILENTIVPGFHMKQNILNACLVLHLMNVEDKKITEIMENYPGIHHRLENFFQLEKDNHKINFYNDSAATVPDATAAAINAFETAPILIAGGTDKNLDFTPFAENAHKAKAIYLLSGTGTDKLLPLLKEKNIAIRGIFDSLDELLLELKGDIEKAPLTSTENIVFSPGATSFGMFKNEFDRGNQFKSKVKLIFG
ncbi:MAG: UDP-N-acetylmuramoyl-L-alanine--D-glutamate ligase [Treponemataceae bacterium]|nr:UDP-N-acetylmuramoyl-L-alanine--D-glutamate ligase [Treponemataceae bacterium]